MMKRKPAHLLVSLALMLPTGAFALGLGNITMNSALDQQLDATIQLQSATPEDLKALQISMASNELFHQYGVERMEFLSGVQFKVVSKNGDAYIKLTSDKPIREPFLNFLVEATWPSGRVIRQFTVLVDPPTMVEETSAPVQAAQVTAPKRVARAEPVKPRPAEVDVAAAVTTTGSGALEYGRTQRNDTLWGVAKQMRPSQDVTPQQVMLALLKDNPDAFYRNNVNNLKAGYVLRINEPSQISSISASEAAVEINRQYQAWKRGKIDAAVAPAPAPTPTKPVEGESAPVTAATSVAQDARLKLVSPGDKEGAGTGAGQSGESSELQGALTLAQEELAANRQETEELRNRLTSLEEQIKSLQHLVNLKDNQLATMQQGGGAQKTAATESLLDNPLILGIIAVIVLLLGILGWLLIQRRKMAEYQESILSQSATAPATEVAAPAAAAGAASIATASDGGESSLLTDFSSTTMEGLQTDIGEIDPVSEADVYLAYGRYNQAEEIIQQALNNDPTREEYKLKLLEIYFAAKEQDKFVEQAQSFRNSLSGDAANPMWSKVVVMGKELCPGNALFTESVSYAAEVSASAEVLDDVSSFEAAEDVEFSRDEDASVLDELANIEAAAANLQGREREESDLDFEAELEAGPTATSVEDEAASEAAAGEKSNDSNVLDFDVGGFGEEAKEPSEEDLAAQAKLEGDIKDNTLDFGSDFGFSETESDTSSLETSAGEVQTEEATEEASSDEDELDALSGSLGDDQIEFEEDTSFDLEDDLADMADMLDDAAAPSTEKSDDAEIDMIDLGEVGDLSETSFDGFDDDNPFADIDEVGTKLDLARAYIDMGDNEGAQSILTEVLQEGNDDQKQQAEELQKQL